MYKSVYDIRYQDKSGAHKSHMILILIKIKAIFLT